MIEIKKIVTAIKDFIAGINKAIQHIGVTHANQTESTKEKLTVESDKNYLCIKSEMYHKKSNTSFSIGFLMKNDYIKPKLFISVNNVHLLEQCIYLSPTLSCPNEELCTEKGEMWYTAAEQINDDYFSETTDETRKDEIIEQILTEVVKSIDNSHKHNNDSK